MALPAPHDVTQLLLAWRNGDEQALEKLTPLVYDKLRRLAARYLRRERVEHMLQATALVNEAYLQLIAQPQMDWQSGSGSSRKNSTLEARAPRGAE